MNAVTHAGRTITYRQTGEGDRPVLYVHGAGGDHRLWVEQYAPGRVAPAVALDLTGHGDSDDADLTPGADTLDAYARDVLAVARETGARTLVGNSMGGAVALWTVLEHGFEPDALVLCGTGAKLAVGEALLDAFDSDLDAALDTLAGPDLLFHEADSDMRARTMAAFRETGQQVTARDFHTCDAFDVRDRLDEIDVPALALTGERDGMTPPSFTDALGSGLPDCETAILDDCAHLSMLERPTAWNERVRAFLGEERGRASGS